MTLHRKRDKVLGLTELVAIALGGMVGGGIFTILGISVSLIGNLTPFSIIIGGILALFAAYSYVKLGVHYQDEGSTYSFFKRAFPQSPFAASVIGWFIIFGYISTLSLYAYTFSSYALSSTALAHNIWARKLVAWLVLAVFTTINVWSVKGMGKIEDLMVYAKLIILAIISYILMKNGEVRFSTFIFQIEQDAHMAGVFPVLLVSSITFVAYEGFQLVINAVGEMTSPEKNIPRAIYIAIILACLIYLVISVGALFAIPAADIIQNKEFALAAGAQKLFGTMGSVMVISGAILATSSAISGTVFGSSRQTAILAADGYMPRWLSIRRGQIPANAIIAMSVAACVLILVGGLELILEFGSITFLLVSLLVAFANVKLNKETKSPMVICLVVIITLSTGAFFILIYEFQFNPAQLVTILIVDVALASIALMYALRNRRRLAQTKGGAKE